MRFLLTICLTLVLTAPAAKAQEDSVFKSYEEYSRFVDRQIATRDFITLILRLGGRDEYTAEALAENDAKLKGVWPSDFRNVTVFRREDLGGGVSQEGRMYWTGKQYAYFYGLLHQREDKLVVISFHLNSSSRKVMERF